MSKIKVQSKYLLIQTLNSASLDPIQNQILRVLNLLQVNLISVNLKFLQPRLIFKYQMQINIKFQVTNKTKNLTIFFHKMRLK